MDFTDFWSTFKSSVCIFDFMGIYLVLLLPIIANNNSAGNLTKNDMKTIATSGEKEDKVQFFLKVESMKNRRNVIIAYSILSFIILSLVAIVVYTIPRAKMASAASLPPNHAVSEPITVALLGIALVGLAGAEVIRRLKKKSADKS